MRLTLADVLTLAGDSDELLDALAEVMAPRPATSRDVVEYLQVPSGSVFDLEFSLAKQYFDAKGLRPTFSYADMLDEAHDEAFTVAKMMDVDMLAQVQASLSDALANGIPFSQWRDEIIPIMQAGGWWGKKNVLDPVTGQTVLARLGTPNRLKTIFRTNMQAAYAAGQWHQIDATKDVAPWLMYDAVDDHRTRDDHREWDRTTLKVGDPWWNDHYPPNGYNCRCSVIQLSDDEVKALNLEPDPIGGPDYGFKDWKNPRTGMLEAIPWGLDPGFAHHPGKSHLKALKKTLKEKVDVLPANMQDDALDGIAATAVATEEAKEAAKAALSAQVAAAQKELAKAAGKAHLKHALDRAHAQAAAVAKAKAEAEAAIKAAKAAQKQAEAKEKLDAIIKAGGANTYEKAALKKLANDPAWTSADATGRLWMFETLTANLKAKQLLDTKLAKYKAAVLAGKTPPPNVAKALDELEADAKAAFLAKIDAEVTAKKAAEEAAQKAAIEADFDAAVFKAKVDPDLALTPGEIPIFEQVVKTIKAYPASVWAQSFDEYVNGLKASKAKLANDAADALQTEVGDFEFASIPGGGQGDLGKKVSALFDAIYSKDKGSVWAQLPTVDKLAQVEKWKKYWANLKAEIEATISEVALKADTTNELETIAKAMNAVPLQEAKDLSNAIFSDMLAGKLDNFTLEALQAYKLGAMNKLDEFAAKAASQPAPNPIPQSASKQWINVEASAQKTWSDLVASGFTTGADSLQSMMQSTNWTSGKWTLKKKKEVLSHWQQSLANFKANKGAPQPAAAAAPPPAAAATPQAGVDSLLAVKPPNAARLTQIGPQKGSNPGGLFQDTTTGEKFYVKFFDAEDRARNELLTGKLYELVGADTPELAVFKWPDGRTALSSRWVDGLKGKQSPDVISNADGAYDYFAADAWLANWDVVGAEFDNLVLKGAKAFRVDVGGGLLYRAQGNAKGAAFGDDVVELATLRSGGRNPQAVAVFKDIPEAKIVEGVRRILKPSDDQIRQLVEAFGPTDKAARDKLLKTLLNRREYLRKKYPNAVPAQPTRTSSTQTFQVGKVRVSENDAAAITNARGSGYAFNTDGPDIEDHQVLVSHLIAPDGRTITRTTLKLTPGAAERARKLIAPNVKGSISATVDDTVSAVRLEDAKAGVLLWVRGVNARTSKAQPLEAKDIERAAAAKLTVEDTIASLEKLAGTLDATGETLRVAHIARLREFERAIDAWIAKDYKPGQIATETVPQIDLNSLPSEGRYKKLVVKTAAPPPAEIQWKTRDGLPYEPVAVDRGRHTLQDYDSKQSVSMGAPVFEGRGPNGERIIAAVNNGTERAPYGTIEIDVPGGDAAAAQRAFDLLDGVFKVDASYTPRLDRDEQYLNAIARLRLFKSATQAKYQQFEDLGKNPDQALRVAKKIEFLNRELKIDIEASSGWATRDGVDQAFGNGVRVQLRPDTDGPDWQDLESKTYIFHNPNGTGNDSGSVMGEKLMAFIDSGGMIASQMERLRRGIYGHGVSNSADRDTGGASYLFARLQEWSDSNGTGIYWRSKLLRRVDPMAFPGDPFGRTTDAQLLSRRHSSAAELKALARTGNEVNFKNGISLFDEVIAIVVENRQVAGLLKELRAHGYQTWPDGRRLEEVIIGRTEWDKTKATRR